MKNRLEDHDLRSFNLISTLLSIINTNDEDDSYVFLARALLDNITNLDEISIYDLAEECCVSRSSLQRFIKYIGFDSFANLKSKVQEVLIHNQRFVRSCQIKDFSQNYRKQTLEMMDSIEALANSVHMDYFVELIHNAKRIVFCYATFSTLAPVAFQEAMVSYGKNIRCITNSSKSIELLNNLEEFDLLVTLSVTGNYALVTMPELENVRAFKVLFTLNHLDKFKNVYNRIIYLSSREESFDYIRDGLRDAYTEQGLNYLFDLLLHKYVQKYGTPQTKF